MERHPAIAPAEAVTRVQERQYAGEASNMGLRPGEWPNLMPVRIEGRLVLFSRFAPEYQGDELTGWRYMGPGGLELLVIND